MAKLPELCEIQYGYAFDSACFTENNTYLPLVRIRDVKRGYSETFYSGNYPSDYVIDSGSLLVGMDGEFNIARWKGGHALLNQRVCKITAKEDVNEEYIRFALSKALKKIENRTAFVTVKHLSAKELNQLEIDVPNYTTQTDIAKVLTQIESIISARQQQLQKLDELVKARFVEFFGDMVYNQNGWKMVNLGSVCDVRDGTHDSPKYFSEGYPLVTSKNVTSGRIDFAGCSLICKEDYDKINERSRVDFGDILMPMIGTVGKPVIVDVDVDFAIKNVALIKFYENSMVINFFVRALLQSDYFDHAVISKIRGGTQKFIALSDIRKLEIYLPPMDIQKKFAAFVEQTDKMKAAVQKALDEAQLLFDSLMQKYFG